MVAARPVFTVMCLAMTGLKMFQSINARTQMTSSKMPPTRARAIVDLPCWVKKFGIG
jgi:hypothetical protein